MDADFSRMLTLGRQHLTIARADLKSLLREFGRTVSDAQLDTIFRERSGDGLLDYLGAQFEALDISPYEGATIVHDMNRPVPADWHNRYSCVFDGGTTPQLFNMPQALLNVMHLLRLGGTFVSVTVANNYLGHGLYQFSPELFYSVFDEKNGFVVQELALTAATINGRWYRVPRLTKSGDRVEITSAMPLLMLAIARKTGSAIPNELMSYNIDYQKQWTKWEQDEPVARPLRDSNWRRKLKARLPRPLAYLVQTGRYLLKQFRWHKDLHPISDAEMRQRPAADWRLP